MKRLTLLLPTSLILSLIAAGCAVPTAAPPLAEEAASAEAPAEEAAMHPALEDGKITILGVSNYDGGRAAADLLVRDMGEEGKVAMLTGVPGALNLEERMRGFQVEIAEKYPGLSSKDKSIGQTLERT